MNAQRQTMLAGVTLPEGVVMPAHDGADVRFSLMAPVTVDGTPFFGGYAEDDMLAEMGVVSTDAEDTAADKA